MDCRSRRYSNRMEFKGRKPQKGGYGGIVDIATEWNLKDKNMTLYGRNTRRYSNRMEFKDKLVEIMKGVDKM